MKSKKLLSLLLTLAMLFSLTVTASAEETGGEMSGSIVILHTNDVHGAIGGYAAAAALKQAYEDAGAYVLLLDAGDFSQGDPTVSVSQGATAVELMNLAGYDAAAPGNHEFDYGYDNLKALEEQADFPILAANVLYSDSTVNLNGVTITTGTSAFDARTIFTAPDGTKIGVFGLTTPETATKAHPAKIQGVIFESGRDMFAAARSQVRGLENAGCEYIVCLGHLGIDEESTGNRSTDLLEEVEGIDIFIDGHSHSTVDKTAAVSGATLSPLPAQGFASKETTLVTPAKGEALLTSTGTKFATIGAIVINDEGITERSFPLDAISLTPDAAVAARAAAIQKEIDDDYGTVFATTAVALNGEKDPGNRTEETNLGDLITDALVWGAEKNGEQVDAAVTNGGGIRASIAAGQITKKDINTVLPFGNTLSIVKVTGAELLEALEASTYATPTAIGGFPQVSGIQFTVDTTKAFDQGNLYPGSTYYAPKSIQRVSIQSVGGKPFDAKATYAIATNDFMAAGGDTYYAFSAASVNYDLGLPMDEVVMDYITEALKGTVTAAAYGEPDGRITISNGLPFTDVAATAAYFDAVKYVYENGIFNGTSATTFAPDATMTRGQMVTVLWRMSGSPEPKAASPFTDVAAASPYAKAIAWAKENGLSNGTSETTFAPGTAISRQQFLTILYNYAGFMEYDTTQGGMSAKEASDYDQISEYARPAMQWALSAGITAAVDGKLMPTAPAPRSQVAEFLANFCQKVVPAETAKAA